MRKRLQVLLEEDEFVEIREAARRARMTVSEWVRQSLREARNVPRSVGVDSKLAAVQRATAHEFPTADIESMLEEIARGRESVG